MGSVTAYLRYYLGNVLTLLGVVGFALGGSWVWLGAATFPLLIVTDLLFQDPTSRSGSCATRGWPTSRCTFTCH